MNKNIDYYHNKYIPYCHGIQKIASTLFPKNTTNTSTNITNNNNNDKFGNSNSSDVSRR